MKRIAAFLVVLVMLPNGARAAGNTSFIQGTGIHAPHSDTNPCPGSTLSMHHDGSTENAFTFQGFGVQEPDYGALAEGYPGVTGSVCGIELLLSRWGDMSGAGAIDAYVWAYETSTNNPGAVLAVTTAVAISGVGYWPLITTHDLEIIAACVGPEGFFVGYWPRSFVETFPEFGCAMDADGPGGIPRANVAPGIGYPTGWQNPSAFGYPLQAFGIGAWVTTLAGGNGACCLPDGSCVQTYASACVDLLHGQFQPCVPCEQAGCAPTPVGTSSWGRVKELYH